MKAFRILRANNEILVSLSSQQVATFCMELNQVKVIHVLSLNFQYTKDEVIYSKISLLFINNKSGIIFKSLNAYHRNLEKNFSFWAVSKKPIPFHTFAKFRNVGRIEILRIAQNSE